MKLLNVAVSVLCFVVAVSAVEARCTWCGPSGVQDWNEQSNWVDGIVPGEDDVAYFPANAGGNKGQRRAVFRVCPPESFRGVILTTNETATSDWENNWQSVALMPAVEPIVRDGAQWTVEGDGMLIATTGIANRISQEFRGTLSVERHMEVALPVGLNPAVTVVGAGRVMLQEDGQLSQMAAFAGDVEMMSSSGVSNLMGFRDRSLTMHDGQTLTVNGHDSMFNPVTVIDSFVDAPEKWSFNGSTWAAGNIPSGPFNPNPPYVQDGELWLTDEPAQAHTVWYTNRVFRWTEDWGMRFTYNPDLPTDTRITTEKRADGNVRNQCISGYFNILFSRTSPTNCSYSATSHSALASNARGFSIYLYRDPNAYVGWINEASPSSTRNIPEQDTGIKLNMPMEIVVSVIKKVMTVTMIQGDVSFTTTHNFSELNARASDGCYIGLAGSSDWWGDNYVVPWVRHRISNFSAWYRDETDGEGWVDVPNAADFSIDNIDNKANWDSLQVTRGFDDTAATNEVDVFQSDGVHLTKSAPRNGAYLFSKKDLGVTWGESPLCFKYRFKTDQPFFEKASAPVISFLFGSKNDSTMSRALRWNSNQFYEYFGDWMYGLDASFELDGGTAQIHASRWDGNVPSSVSVMASTKSMSTVNCRTTENESNVSADFLWDPSGRFVMIGSSSAANRRGNGGCDRMAFENMSNVSSFNDLLARTPYLGVKAFCRDTAYTAITLTDLTVRRLEASRPGRMGNVRLPVQSQAMIKAGRAMSQQDSEVVEIGSVCLGEDSRLTLSPDVYGASTKVGIGEVICTNATLVASSGAGVVLGEHISLGGDPSHSALQLIGDIQFSGMPLVVRIPSAWRGYKDGEISIVDGSQLVGTLGVTAEDVEVIDENGKSLANKTRVFVRGNSIHLDCSNGFILIVR